MALTKPLNVVLSDTKKRKAAPPLGGTWKDRMPKRITAEDAENEPLDQRLFR